MHPPGSGAPAETNFRGLALTLRAGALYDWAFALLMLAAPALLERVFRLPLPGESFYLNVIAALLAIVGAAYWAAASDPATYRPLVWIAVGGRLLGFALLALPALGKSTLAGLWFPALGDLAFALAHLAAGRRLLFR